MLPSIIIDNNFGAPVEIIPVDELHKSETPRPIVGLKERLPMGSFLLSNHGTKQINAVVVVWSYTDRSGLIEQLRLNCDGYLGSPAEAIVQPNSMTLITPYSCTREEFFLSLEPDAMFGSPLDPTKLSGVPSAESVSEVHVAIDSIVFSDGEIVGEDKFKYSTEIAERYFAAQELLSKITETAVSGEELMTRLVTIRREAAQEAGRRAFHRANYAALLQRSPNPDGTILFLRGMTRPSFRHTQPQKISDNLD